MYRHLKEEDKLAAGCLSIVNLLRRKHSWGIKVPSTEEFSKTVGVSVETADRMRDRILGASSTILARKRSSREVPETGHEEIRALLEYLWKLGVQWDDDGHIGTIPDEARCRIVAVARRMKDDGMTYKEFCEKTGIERRTFYRMHRGYDARQELGGLACKSRRPHNPAEETPPMLIDLICGKWEQWRKEAGKKLKVTEFCSWFNDRFKSEIRRMTQEDERCGTKESLSQKTITKHLKQRGLYGPKAKEHYQGERGRYNIFGPLFQGAMDTTTITFFGKIFKWMNFFDIGSRMTVSEKLCKRETGKDVVEVYEEGRQKCPEMVGSVNDRGKVYVGEELKKAVNDDAEATAFLQVHARPARPEDKPQLERHFETRKGWLSSIEEMVGPLCKELERELEPLAERTQKVIWRIVVAMILRTSTFFYNRTKQECIDKLTPLQRLELPPKVSREEAREALRQRAERNRPKKDFLEELLEELGFKRPTRKKQLRKLERIRKDALKEARARLRQIRANPRVNERRLNFNYFVGMARGIADDIQKRECKRRAEDARRRRQSEQWRQEQEALEKQLRSQEDFPERSLLSNLKAYLPLVDRAESDLTQFSFAPLRMLVRHGLENLRKKFGGLFDAELERVLDRMETLDGSDRTKEILRAFVREAARKVGQARQGEHVAVAGAAG